MWAKQNFLIIIVKQLVITVLSNKNKVCKNKNGGKFTSKCKVTLRPAISKQGCNIYSLVCCTSMSYVF